MAKIKGGVPGGWHGGMLPGASSPFRFKFDNDGTADVDDAIAKYVVDNPGPFSYVDEPRTVTDGTQEDETPERSEDPTDNPDGNSPDNASADDTPTDTDSDSNEGDQASSAQTAPPIDDSAPQSAPAAPATKPASKPKPNPRRRTLD